MAVQTEALKVCMQPRLQLHLPQAWMAESRGLKVCAQAGDWLQLQLNLPQALLAQLHLQQTWMAAQTRDLQVSRVQVQFEFQLPQVQWTAQSKSFEVYTQTKASKILMKFQISWVPKQLQQPQILMASQTRGLKF
jgi:hypothetical protein